MSMNMRSSGRLLRRLATLVACAFCMSLATGQKKDMPREDVIEVPAIGTGLGVHNLFQSNMVLQRDKPIPIWGWANPGEEVSVSFGGQIRSDKASIGLEDRIWKVTLRP